jgi:hypothetical protein
MVNKRAAVREEASEEATPSRRALPQLSNQHPQ